MAAGWAACAASDDGCRARSGSAVQCLNSAYLDQEKDAPCSNLGITDTGDTVGNKTADRGEEVRMVSCRRLSNGGNAESNMRKSMVCEM